MKKSLPKQTVRKGTRTQLEKLALHPNPGVEAVTPKPPRKHQQHQGPQEGQTTGNE